VSSLFPKQNYNVLSPSFHIHVSVSNLYILRIGLPILLQPITVNRPSWEYINRSQKHECRNWERGRAVEFLGIHKLDWYSVAAFCVCRCDENPEDCLGVDLNRNFPSGWGLGSTKFMEDSSLPCMEMYKGQTGERTHCKEEGGVRVVGDGRLES
jgi:hypothetical protein